MADVTYTLPEPTGYYGVDPVALERVELTFSAGDHRPKSELEEYVFEHFVAVGVAKIKRKSSAKG